MLISCKGEVMVIRSGSQIIFSPTEVTDTFLNRQDSDGKPDDSVLAGLHSVLGM